MIGDLNLKATPSCIVEELILQYGYNITLDELLLQLTKDRGYRCAKCEGRGFAYVRYTDYYPKLNLYDESHKLTTCDLCKGTGFTDKPMKPKFKTVQDGWEEE